MILSIGKTPARRVGDNFFDFFICLSLVDAARLEELGHGSLDAWARQSLGVSPDADYCIPDEQARALRAQVAPERGACLAGKLR